jgi:predicted transcriptional regulator
MESMGSLFSTPIQEYMSATLIAVRPTTKLDEVLHTLEQRDISCVAVTDDHDALLGILSMTDLLRDAVIELGAPGERRRVTPSARTAGDIMQTNVVAIDEERPVREAAELMVSNRIHRVVVRRKGRAVGVCSTRDVARAVLFYHVEAPISVVMTKPVETIDVGDTIDTAIARLGDKQVHGLVVVDNENPVGVFTQAEAIAARALPVPLRAQAVERVMSYETICLDVSTPLHRAAGHAIAMRVRRILAVHGRRLQGIVSGFDLVRVATMDLA